MNNFGIYVIITRPVIPHSDIAKICVKKGVKMLQLRENHLPDNELLRIACELRDITKNTNTRLVINDRPDIAALCQADYLHLGQDDLNIADARKIVGSMKIGLSTHSITQAREALKQNPAYIGFGPVFSTNAKEKPDPPVGSSLIKTVNKMADIPVVAIGGIFPHNIREVIQSGAKNIAMIRYLVRSDNFAERLEEVQALMH